MDLTLRQSLWTSRSRGLSCTDITIRDAHQIHSQTNVQSYKQHCRIRRPDPRGKQSKGTRGQMDLSQNRPQIVAGQVEKEYTAREPELVKYLATIRALERRFQGFTLKYIPRA